MILPRDGGNYTCRWGNPSALHAPEELENSSALQTILCRTAALCPYTDSVTQRRSARKGKERRRTR